MIKNVIAAVIASLVTAVLFLLFSGVSEISNSFVPTGAVSAFDLTICPDGWEDYNKANGRFLAATGNSGKDGLTLDNGEQGGSNKIILNISNLPRIAFELPELSTHTSKAIMEKNSKSKTSDVNINLVKKEIGDGAAIQNYPEFIALKFCRKR